MSKVGLIIGREYLTRVKKKSFILMTILGPLLFAGFMAAVVFLSQQEKDTYNIAVLDDSYILSERMPPMSKKLTWNGLDNMTFEQAIGKFKNDSSFKKYDFLLWIPPTLIQSHKGVGKIVYRDAPNVRIQGQIEESVRLSRENYILNNKFKGDSIKLKEFRAEYEDIRSLTQFTPIDIDNIDKKGEKIDKNADFKVAGVVGIVFGTIIFSFIFFFGTQVMRGVIEEKTNRIIEIIISSVKPFQLMMGKIIGIGLVGLTQFLIWAILTNLLVMVAALFIPDLSSGADIAQMSQEMMVEGSKLNQFKNEMSNALKGIPWMSLITSFVFFFSIGYLIYAALLAAIGAAVDNETDSQQFMLPVTLPLILSFYIIINGMASQNFETEAIYWMSFFPLTSPVVMLVRIAMGNVDLWEVLLSMALLILTFIGVVWMAGKIYRTGILMYGKKPSYKEIFKWLKY